MRMQLSSAEIKEIMKIKEKKHSLLCGNVRIVAAVEGLKTISTQCSLAAGHKGKCNCLPLFEKDIAQF